MQRPLPQPETLKGLHVLVVDAAGASREIIEIMLECAGAAITVSASIPDAAAVLRERTPDVVITRVSRDGFDGTAMLDEIRALPAPARDTPVVALTPGGDRYSARRLGVTGFRGHVTTPVDPRELCRVVLDVAGRRS
jgi:CheY-like chemotaxis protein